MKRKWSKITGMDEILIPSGSKGTKKVFLLEQWNKGLLQCMLKIGFLGFGGGSALIPVFEKEVVTKRKWLTKEEYAQDVLAATITPGALPVEIAAGIGKRLGGSIGMLLSAICVAFPGAFMTILLLSALEDVSQNILTGVHILSILTGIYICYLLIRYELGIMQEAKKSGTGQMIHTIAIMAGVFMLTGEKSLYTLLATDRQPFFDISTLRILLLALFWGCCDKGNQKEKKIILMILSVLYIACVKNDPWISLTWVRLLTEAVMLGLAIKELSKEKKKTDWKMIVGENGICIMWLLIFLLPSFFILKDQITFIFSGIGSTLLSFGGGDAYLTVAEGFFVHSGLVDAEFFYAKLVMVANLLPGSILCKILPGIGYYIGCQMQHGRIDGYLAAIAGFGISVIVSVVVFNAVSCIYASIQERNTFSSLPYYIKPTIGGLLLSVLCTLIRQSLL